MTSTQSVDYTDHYTRAQLIEYRGLGSNMQPDKDLMKNVFQFLEFAGATKMLPVYDGQGTESEIKRKQTEMRKAWISDFLDHLIINNKRIPIDIPVGFVFAHFANGVIDGSYERKGNNVAAFVACINSALTNIVQAWDKDQRKNQKALPSKKATSLESWSDEKVKNLYETLNRIETKGFGVSSLFPSENADRFFNRIKSEYQKRF